jgi:hypothetical protein
MSTTQVLGETPYASPGQPHASLTGRIDALPASFGLWSFITLLSLGGFFELYDLFQTGYISAGLLAEGFSTPDRRASSALPTRRPLPPPPLWGCLLAPVCWRRWQTSWGAA